MEGWQVLTSFVIVMLTITLCSVVVIKVIRGDW